MNIYICARNNEMTLRKTSLCFLLTLYNFIEFWERYSVRNIVRSWNFLSSCGLFLFLTLIFGACLKPTLRRKSLIQRKMKVKWAFYDVASRTLGNYLCWTSTPVLFVLLVTAQMYMLQRRMLPQMSPYQWAHTQWMHNIIRICSQKY